eukprot:38626_1
MLKKKKFSKAFAKKYKRQKQTKNARQQRSDIRKEIKEIEMKQKVSKDIQCMISTWNEYLENSEPQTYFQLIVLLINIYHNHILLEESESFQQAVEQLFANFSSDIYDNHKLLHESESFQQAFEQFINKQSNIASSLANFTDDLLKKQMNCLKVDLENIMDHVVMLYGFIANKDRFEIDYEQHLASRLLAGSPQSENLEKSMISKLKTKCKFNWAVKVEQMIKDVEVSKFRFKYHIDELHCNVLICTSGAWPMSAIKSINVPQEIKQITQNVSHLYSSKFNDDRGIQFKFDHGKANVSVQFNSKTAKILVVSTYQMLILLLFNDKRTWTFK